MKVVITSICLLNFLFLISCKTKTDFNKLSPVSYSKNIEPIIKSNCTFSGCHGDSLNASFKLTSYDALKQAGIEAGNPDNSKLFRTINTLNDLERMPKKPYKQLTDEQIQLIYVWIGQGAKNN